MGSFSSLRPIQNRRHFADEVFKCNFLNENVWILIKILMKFVPRKNGRHFADDIFKWIFLNENVWFPIKTSLKCVPEGLINNIPAFVEIMFWCRPGHKPLSEPMMVSLTTHIYATRPQWVNEHRLTCIVSFYLYVIILYDYVYFLSAHMV